MRDQAAEAVRNGQTVQGALAAHAKRFGATVLFAERRASLPTTVQAPLGRSKARPP
jgi:hypothetical protein